MYLPQGQSVQKFTYQNTEITFDFSKNVNCMVNASEMANSFGKQPTHFLRQKQTKTYIQTLEKHYANSHSEVPEIVKVKNGGNNRGTWMHRKLAIRFAQWLSPEFAIWVDDIIESILLGNRNTGKPLDLDSRILAKEILINDLEVAELLGLSPMRSKTTVVKQVAKMTGVDYNYILKEFVDETIQIGSQQKYLSPTDLAGEFDFRSAQEVNKFLERFGLQTFDKDKQEWIPTSQGKAACKREKWLNGSDHHLIWNKSKILSSINF